jgi:hypothetical protein
MATDDQRERTNVPERTEMTTRAGRSVYGHPVGALMLDTSFPRPVGDIGNAQTWPFPMLYRVVRGAVPDKVLRADDLSLLDPFIEAATELVEQGVRAITTSCGYLAVYQRELAEAVEVPMLTSSLLQVPLAAAIAGNHQTVGILTVRDMLTERHFTGVGWSSRELPVVVGALDPDTTFVRLHAPLGPPEQVETDAERLSAEVVSAAVRLVREHPSIGALVMECPNLVPYSQAVRRATALPVFDHFTLVMQAHRAVVGHEFPQPQASSWA